MILSPKQLAVEWYSGSLRKEDWPAIAQNALEAGYDNLALSQLAGLIPPEYGDLDRLIESAIKTLNLPYLSQQEAMIRRSAFLFETEMSDNSTPYAISSKILKTMYSRYPWHMPPVLYQIDDCVEMIEKYPEQEARWNEKIRHLARKFVTDVNATEWGTLTRSSAEQLRP